jgi:hypothetical protein
MQFFVMKEIKLNHEKKVEIGRARLAMRGTLIQTIFRLDGRCRQWIAGPPDLPST